MKKLFPGYFEPTEDEFKTLWNEGVFIFDTNILLHLFRCSKETYNEYTEKVLKDERIKDRIWIPNQVGEEFFRNKDEVIKEQDFIANNVRDQWKISKDEFLGKIRGYVRVHPDKLVKFINDAFELKMQELESLISKNINKDTDSILAFIEEFTQDKIGDPFENKELDEIYEEGKLRFKLKYPPGYKDSTKQGNEKYGDLVIWKQILKQVQNHKSDPKFKHIILVINDEKSDWWLKENSKIKSPRHELVYEIKQAGASLFYMYNLKGFLKSAKQYLNIELSESSEEEINEIYELATTLAVQAIVQMRKEIEESETI
jgi:hypothetical protein